MKTPLSSVVICGGARIPFVKSSTAYSDATDQDMLTRAFQGVVDKFNLHGETLGDIAAGAVVRHPREANLAHESALGTTLNPRTPAYDISRACGTGLEGTMAIAAKIALGQIDCGIAGGADTNSDLPLVLRRKAVQAILKARSAKSLGGRIAALSDLRPKDLLPSIPQLAEPRTGLSMGEHCERMAKEWKIDRASQDELAMKSHKNAAAAYANSFFEDLIVEFKGLTRDAFVRSDASIEALGKLKPAFDRSPSGTLTAGNSSPLTDGASAVFLASEARAKAKGHPILARMIDAQASAVDFVGGEGLLMAPTIAVGRLLERNKLKLQDFDYYEIHEAFAAQVLCTLKAWESDEYCRTKFGAAAALGPIDRTKLNVVGSSVALGHPFAATGGRIVATLAKLLAKKGSGRGLISICTAGGMGVAAILEAP